MRCIFCLGNNNGTIDFLADDNTLIKCHDFVFESQCYFGSAKIHFQEKQEEENNQIILEYPSKIIRLLISKIYLI
jgi:hypothetical protein